MTGNNFSFAIGDDGIAELEFDVQGSKVNVLNSSFMEDLETLLSGPALDPSIKAMVITSRKPGIFIAGADLHEIYRITSYGDALEKSGRGQAVISRIEKLPYPTVCVINGACLGGGLELCLAATFRIVTDGEKTKLGLPETTLGLIPGFGGTWRLPKIAGLANALDMILSGRQVSGPAALKSGLADACYAQAFVDDKTAEFVRTILDPAKRTAILKKRRKKTLYAILTEGNPFGRFFVYRFARSGILRKTRGFYPAAVAALDAVRKNFGRSQRRALETERRLFSGMATTDIAKKLIGIFFIGEELKKAYSDAAPGGDFAAQVRYAGVTGAGKMGGAIAWLLSYRDIDVRMKDLTLKNLANGYKAAREIYAQLERLKKIESRVSGLKMHRITSATDYSGFDRSDFVIEAVAEDLGIKKEVYAGLEKVLRDDAVIATNTSSYSLKSLSEGMAHPERFVGMHFFNPVNRMHLVEIVRGETTSEPALHKAVALARRLGKIPVVIGDCNGFLVNRILMAYLTEAVHLLEEGADFTLIDRAIYDWGMPMGPFALLDEIGIKIGFKVASILLEAYPARAAGSVLFSKLGAIESLGGRSAGRGFFLYGKGGKKPNPEIRRILRENGVVPDKSIREKQVVDRCVLRMINESSLCLEEKIIDDPGFLDLAMIHGTGFPPFRGGVLKYADSIGIDNVVKGLESLESVHGARFKPSRMLGEMKTGNRRFYP